MFLVARNISQSYAEQTVLFPLDLTIEPGQRLAIIGETGSGKTTLLKCLAGLLDLQGGEILFEGERVKGPREVLLPGHPSICYLSQGVDLRNHYRVEDLLERHSIQALENDQQLAKLCRVNNLLSRKTDQLSGGEKQRIALAIELSKHPKLLLLDEPFAHLDMGHRNTLRQVLDDLHEQNGLTQVIVSHNPTEILGWADRILVLKKGGCVQVGTPVEIYERPTDTYVAQLLGPFNELQLEAGQDSLIVRPERLRIVAAGTVPLGGIIRKKHYEGSGVLYEVESKGVIYWIKDNNSGHPIGGEVGIFVDTTPYI